MMSTSCDSVFSDSSLPYYRGSLAGIKQAQVTMITRWLACLDNVRVMFFHINMVVCFVLIIITSMQELLEPWVACVCVSGAVFLSTYMSGLCFVFDRYMITCDSFVTIR